MPVASSSGPQQGFFSTTGLQKLDDLVNKMKSIALEVLNEILRNLFEKVPNSVKKNSAFLPKSIQFCPYLAQSLIAIGQRPDIL